MATHFTHATLGERLKSLSGYHTRGTGVKGASQFRIALEVTRTRGRVRHLSKKNKETLKAEETLAAIHRKVYLDYNEERIAINDRSATVRRIGYWGQCKALAVLWSLARAETAPNIKTNPGLAAAIIEHANRANLMGKYIDSQTIGHELYHERESGCSPSEWTEYKKKKRISEELPNLLANLLYGHGAHSIIPPIEASHQLRNATVAFVVDALNKTESYRVNRSEQDVRNMLDGSDHIDPESCFWALTKHLGIECVARKLISSEVPALKGVSWISERFLKYVMSNDPQRSRTARTDIPEYVRNVRNCLQHVGPEIAGCKNIAILEGPAHTGKKSVVGDFLRSVKSSSGNGDFRFRCEDESTGDHAYDLPVFCITTPYHDDISLALNVLIFLERVESKKGKAAAGGAFDQKAEVERRRRETMRYTTTPSLGHILEQIAKLHKDNPALFIFTDASDAAMTDVHNLVRRYSIRELIESLFESDSSRSRYLFTMENKEPFLRQYAPQRFKMSKPTLARLDWYIDDADISEFRIEAKKHNFQSISSDQTSGLHLMLLAALRGQPEYGASNFFDFIKLHFDGVVGNKKSLDAIAYALLNSWHEEKFLPVIALVLAADDGLMEKTIHVCLSEWNNANTGVALPEPEMALERLRDLSQLSGGFFINHIFPASSFAEEARFDERAFNEGEGALKVFRFDTSIADLLRKYIWAEEKYRGHMRCAYRLIAAQARSRARIKLLRGASPYALPNERVQERSVQAFIGLLLSLDEFSKDNAAENAQGEPLNSSTNIVFSLHEGVHHQPTAIRYAYHVLLRGEADRDHRLSMSMDADLLRLRLYILLVADLGTIGVWEASPFPRTRDVLPKELKRASLSHLSVLAPSDRVEILVSLALSAYYTQHFPILRWVEHKLWEYHRQKKDALDVSDALSRVIAARVDFECKIGHPIAPPLEEDGSRRNTAYIHEKLGLDAAQRHLDQDIEYLCPNLVSANGAMPKFKGAGFEESKAWLRLSARRILLKDLVTGAHDILEDVMDLLRAETNIRTLHNHDKSLIRHGRTGRLIMRLQSRDFPVLSPKTGSQWSIAELPNSALNPQTLVHANVARLTLYSGAERILTMLDYARSLLGDGKLVAANTAVSEARRITWSSTASDTVRIDVLFVEIAILLAGLEYAIQGGKVLKSPQSDLNRIHTKLDIVNEIASAHRFNVVLMFWRILVRRYERVCLALNIDVRRFQDGLPINKICAIEFKQTVAMFGCLGLTTRLRDLDGNVRSQIIS